MKPPRRDLPTPRNLRPLVRDEETGAMRVILTQGRYALVDEVDAEEVGKLNWQFERNVRNKTIVYARTKIGFDSVRMTHYLLGPDVHVTFGNGNMLDHRRVNMHVMSLHEAKRHQQAKRVSKSNTGHHNVYKTGYACYAVKIRIGERVIEKLGMSTLGEGIRTRDRLLTENGLPIPPMPKSQSKKPPVSII